MKSKLIPWLHDRLSKPFGTECVEWPFGNRGWYGEVSIKERKTKVTHIALESIGLNRPPAPNNLALHSCDNPSCFNPNHLRWGSNQDNQDDMHERGRGRPGGAHGESHPNAKLTEHDIHVIFALRRLGHNAPDISKMFGMSERTIYDVLSGKRWAHLGLAA